LSSEPSVSPLVAAERLPDERRPARRWRVLWRVAREVLHDVAIAVLVVVLFVTFVAQAFRVQGPSMMPLLRDGERIVVYKLGYRWGKIQRGDVVVFWYPLDPSVSFIKRVVGLPGERIEIHRGMLFVNENALREPYVPARFLEDQDLGPLDVKPGHYFVMGDHRNGSHDSRKFGEVPAKYIYGRAVFRLWPFDRMGVIR
jgi:signal peptidase I